MTIITIAKALGYTYREIEILVRDLRNILGIENVTTFQITHSQKDGIARLLIGECVVCRGFVDTLMLDGVSETPLEVFKETFLGIMFTVTLSSLGIRSSSSRP